MSRHAARAASRLVLALAIAAGTFLWQPARAVAGTLTVSTLVDEQDGSCGDGDCSLRDAVALAAPGDTVTFSVTGTIPLTLGRIYISKPLSLTGPGMEALTISGGGASRILEVNAGPGVAVAIRGLTFAEADSGGGFGGAISNATIRGGSDLRITRCRFVGNRSGGNGGAIFSNGNMTVTHSVFLDNSGSSGGAIATSFGSLAVASTTLRDNVASDDGGAIDADNEATIDVANARIIDNTAESDGGGIHGSYDTPLTLVDSELAGNHAYDGGGLALEGQASVARTSLSHNAASDRGGAIHAGGSVALELTNSSIYSNTAVAGGGIYLDRSDSADIVNCTIASNRAVATTDNLYSSECAARLVNSIVADARINSCSGWLSPDSSHNLSTSATCYDAHPSFVQVSAEDLGLVWQAGVLRIGAGSVALDAGDDATGTANDQRGWSRPQDGDEDGAAVCDIGAFEYVPGLRSLYVPAVLR